MINVISSSRYRINRNLIKSTLKKKLVELSIPETETINLIFIGKNKMRDISSKYKKEDVALPVLSFSYKNDAYRKTFGEVFLCYPQIVLLAAERSRRVDDMINKMIEHGITNLIK